MGVIDSHCHLNYLDDPDAALTAARDRGVVGFLCIGVDRAGHEAVLGLAARHADVWASIGIHPDSAADFDHCDDWLPAALDGDRVVAVGETGLDYYRDPSAAERARQRDSFAWHLGIAAERDLPVVVHTRGAETDTIDLIRAAPDTVGVLHCFTESWELARAALERGYYVSMSGIVTFKNAASVRDVAARVPLDRLLVETDCPWLAPVPNRGKTNQPAYVVDTLQFVAELRGLSAEALAARTSANFRALFPRAAAK
ncbi:MAG: TatD family hydrolase [Pseudomonadota bacterium]